MDAASKKMRVVVLVAVKVIVRWTQAPSDVGLDKITSELSSYLANIDILSDSWPEEGPKGSGQEL